MIIRCHRIPSDSPENCIQGGGLGAFGLRRQIQFAHLLLAPIGLHLCKAHHRVLKNSCGCPVPKQSQGPGNCIPQHICRLLVCGHRVLSCEYILIFCTCNSKDVQSVSSRWALGVWVLTILTTLAGSCKALLQASCFCWGSRGWWNTRCPQLESKTCFFSTHTHRNTCQRTNHLL